ncbi:MAG TPA: GNAT family N-acetyltransferase, partial [Methylomirabilota bacterium]|nr:GNAT family N-acetyltransferase [Methylomirabilota bacterium]
MKIELRQARSHEFPILERLMQLYLYDFAAIDDWPIADDGRYGNAATIESFWNDPQMSSFFVRVDGVLAGFVLVRDGAYFAGEGTRDISEFFILRRHRRRGVGSEVA